MTTGGTFHQRKRDLRPLAHAFRPHMALAIAVAVALGAGCADQDEGAADPPAASAESGSLEDQQRIFLQLLAEDLPWTEEMPDSDLIDIGYSACSMAEDLGIPAALDRLEHKPRPKAFR